MFRYVHVLFYLTILTLATAQPPGGFPGSGCNPFNTASCTTTTASTSSASSTTSTPSSVIPISSSSSSSISIRTNIETNTDISSSSSDNPTSVVTISSSFTTNSDSPFISSSASSPYSSDGSGSGSGNDSGNGSGNSSSGSAYGSTGSPYGNSSGSGNSGFAFSSLPIFSKLSSVLTAHAVCACLAWAFFFPLGSIIIRVLRSRHLAWLHAALQLFAYAMFTAAVGMGIWLVKQFDQYSDVWHDPHVIIGLVVFALVFFQPILGFVHHHIFKTRGVGRRTGYAYMHVWLGRTLITLGIINGGLGLRLVGRGPIESQDTTRRAEIAYGVLAGLVWLVCVAVMVWAELPRKEGSGSGSASGGGGPTEMWVRTLNREGDERKSIDGL